MKLRAMRARSPLVRECMAELLGTLVLLVRSFELHFDFESKGQKESNGVSFKIKAKLEKRLVNVQLKILN